MGIPPGYDFKVVKFRFPKNQEKSKESYEFRMKIFSNEPLNHGLSKFSDIRSPEDYAVYRVYSEYDEDFGKKVLEQFNNCSRFGSNQVNKVLEQFRIEGTSRTLDQMKRHNPISFYTSGDLNFGDLDYP